MAPRVIVVGGGRKFQTRIAPRGVAAHMPSLPHHEGARFELT
jgi:hypothetical protein